jgi:CHAT domain
MNSGTPVNKILILAANPKGTSRLRLDEELREIKNGLRRAKAREQFLIESAEAVRYRDIHRAIIDFEPQIVHFSGHGAQDKGLVFEDETGQEKLVDAEALAGLFELFAEHLKCVLLNACYSEIQAQAIAFLTNFFGKLFNLQTYPLPHFLLLQGFC